MQPAATRATSWEPGPDVASDAMWQPSVFIVLPVHNRRETTRAFCDCLQEQTYRRFFLILVDDGSSDETSEMVLAYPFPKVICRGDGSLWWAGGLRKGMARLAALDPRPDDLVLWINDDTSIQPHFLDRAVQEIHRQGTGVLLCVPARFHGTLDGDRGCYVSNWPLFTFRGYGRHPEFIDCANTRCLLARYGDLARCGSFRPRLLPHYLSDYEYTIRARRRGLRIVPAESVSCGLCRECTGHHSLEGKNGAQIARRMFSPRFSGNPVHVFIFILLATPPAWKVVCWAHALRSVVLAFLFAAVVRRLRRVPRGVLTVAPDP